MPDSSDSGGGPKFVLSVDHDVLIAVFTIVTILALLLAYLVGPFGPLTFVTCFGPAGKRPWPVDSRTLVNTHFQPQVGSSKLMSPHEGIDIAADACADVRAVADGTIVMVVKLDFLSAVVVETAGDPGRGYLYQHLDESSVSEGWLGDSVAAGAVLGKLAVFKADTAFNHVHLEHVERTDADTSGVAWSKYRSIANPLASLEPTSVDDVAPEILAPSGAELATFVSCVSTAEDAPPAFWLRRRASESEAAGYVCPEKLFATDTYDVICRVGDLPGGGATLAVAPSCVSTTVVDSSGAAAWGRDVVLDGPKPESGFAQFARDGTLDSAGFLSGERVLYLVTTSDAAGEGGWKPSSAGTYTITVEVRDAAGTTSSPRSLVVVVS